MNTHKNEKLRDYYLKKKKDQKYEKILEINEIDANNLKIIYFDPDISKEQSINTYSKQNQITKDKKNDLTILSKFLKQICVLYEWNLKIERKINLFLDRLYLKIPGYIFGFIGLILYIFSTYLSLILYVIIDPTYSIYHNWISELGIGPNGANIIFCLGWIFSSGFLFFFNVNEIKSLKKKMKIKSRIYPLALYNVIFTLGIFLVGFFPANLIVSHIIGASFYFLGGFLFFSYYGIIALFNRQVPRLNVVIVGFISTCFILFLLSPEFTVQILELGITTTSAEWSIFISEISLMLLILKHSLIDKYYLKYQDKDLFFIDCSNLNKNELYFELSNNICSKN